MSGGSFQAGDLGLGTGDEGICIDHVQITGEASAATVVGDFRTVLLGAQVAVSNGELVLNRPELAIRQGHLGGQTQAGGIKVSRDGGLTGAGGLEVAAIAAKQVQLPSRTQ